jgi:hypothetical protein
LAILVALAVSYMRSDVLVQRNGSAVVLGKGKLVVVTGDYEEVINRLWSGPISAVLFPLEPPDWQVWNFAFTFGKSGVERTCGFGFCTERRCSFPRFFTSPMVVVFYRVHLSRIAFLMAIPPLLIVGHGVLVRRRRRRRRRSGCCGECGYNLAGNESGVCPECGTAVAENEK